MNEKDVKGGSERYAIVKEPAFDVAVARESQWYGFCWSEDFAQNPEGSGPVTGARYMIIDFSDKRYIGVENTNANIPSDFKIINIPKTTWAVFYSNGQPDGMVWPYIFGDWFPKTGYKQQAGAPILLTFLPIKNLSQSSYREEELLK